MVYFKTHLRYGTIDLYSIFVKEYILNNSLSLNQYKTMGRNLDRGLEDRSEKDSNKGSKRVSSADRVRDKTRKELYDNLKK